MQSDIIQQARIEIQRKSALKAEKKKRKDKIVRLFFFFITCICSLIIVIVAGFIIVKGLTPFFKIYTENGHTGSMSFSYFFTGLQFNHGYDQETGTFMYGVGFLVVNTLYINLISYIISIPTSILTSLFIARIAPKPLKKIISTGVDLLASIPSVIFGMFGLGVIVPLVRSIGRAIGLAGTSGISLLAGAIILALMSMPTMISVMVTSLNAIDESQIKASLALGASKAQTNFKIALKNAKSGIFAGIILGIGRALGEATAVTMVTGSPIYGITANPFDPTVTLTTQMLLAIGEATPNSLNYDARFSAGLVLLVIIILINFLLNNIKDIVCSIDRKPSKSIIFLKQLFTNFRNPCYDLKKLK